MRLRSLACPAPFEYEDADRGVTDGTYTIEGGPVSIVKSKGIFRWN